MKKMVVSGVDGRFEALEVDVKKVVGVIRGVRGVILGEEEIAEERERRSATDPIIWTLTVTKKPKSLL